MYKLGLEFFLSNGPSGVMRIKDEFPQIPLFLDLKMHDIPNTVGKGAAALRDLAPEILTVHSAGGPAMISTAAAELPGTRIAAVTVLTSIDKNLLGQLGLGEDPEEVVAKWAKLAVEAGASAIVASPLEVRRLRRETSADISLITPGIRFETGRDDQARTMTPIEALEAGADYLVIGRPITQAADPTSAAASIYQSLIGTV